MNHERSKTDCIGPFLSKKLCSGKFLSTQLLNRISRYLNDAICNFVHKLGCEQIVKANNKK